VLYSESKVVYNSQRTDFISKVSATVRALSTSNTCGSRVFSLADEVDIQLMEQRFLVHLLEVNIHTTVVLFELRLLQQLNRLTEKVSGSSSCVQFYDQKLF